MPLPLIFQALEQAIDFSGVRTGDTMKIIYGQQSFEMYYMNAALCDQEGNLFLYTNGCDLGNGNKELILANDTLNNTNKHIIYCYDTQGYPSPRSAIMLPDNNDSSLFHLITLPVSSLSGQNASNLLLYARIKKSNQQFEYETIDSVLVERFEEPFFNLGHLSACLHGNGKDWWLFANLRGTDKMMEFLISKGRVLGPYSIDSYIPSQLFDSNGGNAVFSPDGKKFADYGFASDVKIFDFDRCTGLLSNTIHIPIQDAADTIYAAGCAFSNNSRYLYAASSTKVYQFDMYAADIVASKTTVAEWDGFYSGGNPSFPMYFYQMQLAPDNKIYMTSSGGRRNFHVIEYPDSAGMACHVIQHKQMLHTAIAGGLPNFPYFRIGAMDAPCAYPGPVANFAWAVSDTLGPLAVAFDNRSPLLPNPHPVAWHWDFGDGSSSAESDPVHTFAASGTYQVCLIAYNEEGADTLCQAVTVTLVGVHEMGGVGGFYLKTVPNPARDVLWYETNTPVGTCWILSNALGKVVKKSTTESNSWTSLNIGGLPAGTYILTIQGRGSISKQIVKF